MMNFGDYYSDLQVGDEIFIFDSQIGGTVDSVIFNKDYVEVDITSFINEKLNYIQYFCVVPNLLWARTDILDINHLPSRTNDSNGFNIIMYCNTENNVNLKDIKKHIQVNYGFGNISNQTLAENNIVIIDLSYTNDPQEVGSIRPCNGERFNYDSKVSLNFYNKESLQVLKENILEAEELFEIIENNNK